MYKQFVYSQITQTYYIVLNFTYTVKIFNLKHCRIVRKKKKPFAQLLALEVIVIMFNLYQRNFVESVFIDISHSPENVHLFIFTNAVRF